MSWSFSPCAIPLLISAATAGGVAVFSWRRHADTPYAASFAGLALAICWYCVGYALEIIAPDLSEKLLWAKIQYPALAVIPALFFFSVLRYVGVTRPLTGLRLVLLVFLPTTITLVACTNEWHRLLWPQATIAASGSCSLLVLDHGPAFWAFIAHSYGLMLLSAALLAISSFSGPGLYRRQSLLLIATLLIPMICNVAYSMGIAPIPHLNPTPIAFTVSMLLGLLGIFRLRLLEVGPIARQTLVERLRDAMLVVDERGCVADLNPAMSQLLACRRAEALGRSAATLLASWPALLEYALTGNEGEFDLSRGEGRTRREFIVSISYLAESPGKPRARVLLLHEVTRLKGLEAQFLQAQKMESVGRLAGGVAHEFNNLLTAIKGHAALARNTLPPEHSAHADLERLLRNVDRAQRLASQLLTFSRRQPISPRLLDLNDLVRDAENLFPHVLGRGIKLVVRPATNPTLVQADPNQIEQVLANLVLNAADAMPKGGIVTIEAANVQVGHAGIALPDLPPGDYALLAVQDTGIGMDEEVKAHLFEPFFTTKEVGKGTGLGLATVYGIVEQHQGQIRVESAPGQGSRFAIYLPRAEG